MGKKLEVKSWKDYSYMEKGNLLYHWWRYYGKMLITIEENSQFLSMVESDCEQLFVLAVSCYIHNMSSEPLVLAIRQGRVQELFDSLPKMDSVDSEFQKVFLEEAMGFLSILVQSYNNPEPTVPLEIGEIEKQLEQMAPGTETKNVLFLNL